MPLYVLLLPAITRLQQYEKNASKVKETFSRFLANATIKLANLYFEVELWTSDLNLKSGFVICCEEILTEMEYGIQKSAMERSLHEAR